MVILVTSQIRDDHHDDLWRQAAAQCLDKKLLVQIERDSSISDDELGLQLNGSVNQSALEPIQSLFSHAGVEVRFFVPPEKRLPSKSQYTMADLKSSLQSVKTVQKWPESKPTDCEVDVYVLVVKRDDVSLSDFGLMFDYGVNAFGTIRQGIALYWDPIRSNFPNDPKGGLLRILAHELSHVLNSHHQDWDRSAGHSYSTNSSIEGYDWSARPNTANWILSESTIKHIKNDPREFVMPGALMEPFDCITDSHKTDHDKPGLWPAPDPSLVPIASSPQADTACVPDAKSGAGAVNYALPNAPNPYGLSLTLSSNRSIFSPGEYIAARVDLFNWGKFPIQVAPLFSSERGTLRVRIHAPGANGFRSYLPPVLIESFDQASTLRPNSSIGFDEKVFFGAKGWTLLTPGRYDLQADLTAQVDGQQLNLSSNVLSIDIVNDNSLQRRCGVVLDAILASSHNYLLQDEIGIYMYLGGLPYFSKTDGILKAALTQYPNCELLNGARLALISTSLNTDLTISALDELAKLMEGMTPSNLPVATADSVRSQVCDRFTSRQRALPTFCTSDRKSPVPDPAGGKFSVGNVRGAFYFEKGSAVISETDIVRNGTLKRIAESLSWDSNRAVQVVGRADSIGTPPKNDWLSNQRALAVRDALLLAGAQVPQVSHIPCGAIDAAPSTSPEAALALDRRVDVIVTDIKDSLHRASISSTAYGNGTVLGNDVVAHCRQTGSRYSRP